MVFVNIVQWRRNTYDWLRSGVAVLGRKHWETQRNCLKSPGCVSQVEVAICSLPLSGEGSELQSEKMTDSLQIFPSPLKKKKKLMENIQLTQPLMYMYIYVAFWRKKKLRPPYTLFWGFKGSHGLISVYFTHWLDTRKAQSTDCCCCVPLSLYFFWPNAFLRKTAKPIKSASIHHASSLIGGVLKCLWGGASPFSRPPSDRGPVNINPLSH